MQTKLKRLTQVLTGATALALVAGVVPMSGSVHAAPLLGGAAPAGPLTITPASGNSGSNFFLGLPAASTCPGNADSGYLVQTFISPVSNDPATIIYAGSGSPAASEPAFTASLKDPFNTQIRNVTPSSDTFIISLPTEGFSFSTQAVPAGAYNVGVACVKDTAGVLQTEKYWATPITVTAATGAGPQNFNYVQGILAAPAAPVLGATLTAGNGNLAGSFTATPSTPATTGFTVTADPVGAGANIALPVAAAGPFTLTGLTNGVAYDVSVIATNSIGNSPASNVVSGTPGVAAQPAIPLSLLPGTGQITASFTAPVVGSGGFTAIPTSYTLAVTPAPGGTTPASFTIPAAVGVITQVVGDLAPGTAYTFTLTPTYTSPDNGPADAASATPNAARLIQQRITVERPPGALILTQRCGVYGSLPAFDPATTTPVATGFPGFPLPLSSEGASIADPATVTASNPLGGTAPDTSPAPDNVLANAVNGDPNFSEYPFPNPVATTTECGIQLGVADLVTSGALAGQYYAADGRLNQVTVTDTRDTDIGWDVVGTMTDFRGTVTTGNNFDGDYLGWIPKLTSVSAPTPTYAQAVDIGDPVLPGTGITGPTSAQGMTDGNALASAEAGKGLGIAVLDARIQLLIPTEARNDVYVGILGFTFA